MKYFSNLFLE